MDALSYAFDGRETLYTDGSDLPVDEDLITSRNMGMGFMEPNFPAEESSKKPFLANQFLEYSVEASNHRNGDEMASAKRIRITDSKSSQQTPSCQVRGCNKDLSNSKDYHKRHRVCDVHSKTAVVVVKGIQQRFCQQCSRFHVLAEFDEGKRSCRKRLAGHNERRRKPQFSANHLLGSDFPKASLLFSGIFPSRYLGSEIVRLPAKDTTTSIFKFERGEKSQERLSASARTISSCALSLLSPHHLNCASNESLANRSIIFGQDQSLRKSRKGGLEKSSTVADSFNCDEGFRLISNDSVESSTSSKNSQDGGNTVDLAGLSLHLQRIEQQKQYGAQVQMIQDIL